MQAVGLVDDHLSGLFRTSADAMAGSAIAVGEQPIQLGVTLVDARPPCRWTGWRCGLQGVDHRADVTRVPPSSRLVNVMVSRLTPSGLPSR